MSSALPASRLDCGQSLNSLSIQPISANNSSNPILIAVGGKDIKIYSINNSNSDSSSYFHPIKQYSSQSSASNLSNNQISPISDLQWHPSPDYSNYIASAPTNGKIYIYNLNSADALRRPELTFDDHERTVNRLNWHNFEGSLLYSGSQDGTVKLWDSRINNSTTSSNSAQTMAPNSANSSKQSYCLNSYYDAISVRDIQCNPHYSHIFAAAYENGLIQIWDNRKAAHSVYTINAHQGLILALDWHLYDHNILASGGVDRAIKIWDLREINNSIYNFSTSNITRNSSVNSSIEPLHTIQTIASVGRIKWRPNRPYEIASAASIMDFKISVWDITEPYFPIGCVTGHKDVVTSVVFIDGGNSLLSTSKDSCIHYNNLLGQNNPNVSIPAQHMRTVSCEWSVHNDLAIINDFIPRNPIIQANSTLNQADLANFSFVRGYFLANSAKNNINKIKGEVFIINNALAAEFNTNSFAKLAENLVSRIEQLPNSANFNEFSESSKFVAICAHNSAVCSENSQAEMAQIWKILGNLFNQPNLSAEPTKIKPNQFIPLVEKAKTALCEENKPISVDFLPQIHVSHAKTAVSSVISTDFRVNLVQKLLKYLIENKGNVQSAVFIVLSAKKYCGVQFDSQLAKQWLFSYIELLLRCELFSLAAQIIQSSEDSDVAQINSKSTTIALTCPYCRHQSTTNGSMCSNPACRKLFNLCCLCQSSVKGLMTWCQGCGHGGHLEHLNSWFSDNSTCPTGCLHNCVPFLPQLTLTNNLNSSITNSNSA